MFQYATPNTHYNISTERKQRILFFHFFLCFITDHMLNVGYETHREYLQVLEYTTSVGNCDDFFEMCLTICCLKFPALLYL